MPGRVDLATWLSRRGRPAQNPIDPPGSGEYKTPMHRVVIILPRDRAGDAECFRGIPGTTVVVDRRATDAGSPDGDRRSGSLDSAATAVVLVH